MGLCLCILLVLTFSSYFSRTLQPYRKGFFYLLLSSLASVLLINLLKKTTHVDCPWDLARYGGSHPYIRNFSWASTMPRHGACFPSGHASGAWAWLGTYYWAIEYKFRWRRLVLATVLVTGLIFGISQQLRGAHFLSHDIWTLAICWFMAFLLYLVFYSSPFRFLRAWHSTDNN